MGVTEKNSGVRWKKVMSKKNRVTTQERKKEGVGTLLLGIDKTVLLSIIYLLNYSSKGLSEVKDK